MSAETCFRCLTRPVVAHGLWCSECRSTVDQLTVRSYLDDRLDINPTAEELRTVCALLSTVEAIPYHPQAVRDAARRLAYPRLESVK
jgi:hypothetical protein